MKAQEEKSMELTQAEEEIRPDVPTAPEEAGVQKTKDTDGKNGSAPAETQSDDSGQIRIEVTAIPVINYALQQNNVSFVRGISIVNDSDSPLKNIKLNIAAAPDFCLPYTLAIDYLPENRTYQAKDIDLRLNAEFLAGITEKIKGSLSVSLSDENGVIASENIEITALAFDEWHGYGFYPELLTAFVTPNHPAISKIIARAAEFMKEWTGDPSMDAYQTQDPNRVLKQAAAVFGALKEENIVYCVPPASFEKEGQRVRLCDTVIQQKTGTCLDLTLLYSSCLEAIGLHPIMIITKGHIFSGVWLDNLSFPEAVQDDPSVITKRLASGIREIAVIETTLAVNGKNAAFDDAQAAAEQELVGTDPIECIIDVHRARLGGISPLPQRIHTDSGWHIEHASFDDKVRITAPKAIDGIVNVDSHAQTVSVPKMMQWERKLLDLGLRNNLINLRFSKTIVPILASSLDDLEDALADGSDFSVLPRPADWRVSQDEISFENVHDLGPYENVIKSEFANKRLRSPLTEGDLTRIIKGLYRASKTSLEENGANTLYLALGLLRWYETARSTKPRYAPIVLLPVEIIRKSASQGYVIRLRDDEPQMNITILEKMKQDFAITVSGLDPLPSDEHGIDMRRVFTILRKAIMGQSHWDVLESAYLGIFSFSQFVMWNDMRNRSDDLVKNKIVKSLIDGKLCWDARSMEIGDRVSEEGVLLPMSADASQLFAIESACKGESFVLHGPPGTGKSQTITSLIANALAQGKSVLFVAEKMAALQVVQKRLESIGIGPFCLELHSNKSKKKDVLEQLRQATEVTRHQTAEQYAQKAQQASKLRAELDSYAVQLHRVLPSGYTLYALINEYEEYRSAPDIPPFTREFAKSMDRAALDSQVILIERLVASGKAVGHPHNHPLSAINITQYSQQLRSELSDKVAAYKRSLSDIAEPALHFSSTVGSNGITKFQDIEKLFLIAKEFSLWFGFPRAWAKAENLSRYLTDAEEMAEHFSKANALCDTILQSRNEMFLQQDGQQLLAEYNTASSKWFIAKIIGLNQLKKKLSVFSNGKTAGADLGKELTDLYSYQTEINAANQLFQKYGDDLGDFYKGAGTDWSYIAGLASAARNSGNSLRDITGDDTVRISLCGDPALRECVSDVVEKYSVLLSAKNACFELLGIAGTDASDNWINQQITLCENILSNIEQLKEWIAFRSISEEAGKAGLKAAADSYINGLSHEDIMPAYKKAMLSVLIMNAIDENSALNSFSGSVFNEKIEQFKRIDKELTQLSQKEIYCRLASRIPDFTGAAAHSSELGILQRMIKSNGRGTSIRKLFEAIPNLLPRLCPCMLMSPISAAQYLDPKREPFDIVVFDEASQLPTCKAVGVLARGKDAVIVGDPKQMPPTSFFAVNTVDEDNPDIEDLESILDDCLALNMPQTHLLWHYRSRHESLIAFSNNHFYENKLYTFPSVNDRESKVSLVHVKGVFERGKSRKNTAEAQAVIAEIKRRCHDPELSKMSLGVVTFNISQQNLIDDLLNEACKSDSELEKWAFEAEEPIFIKNLENVQGDERDVILFSIGYGPDQNGKVYMNFGPLNRDGGWRRLNVAVSRARNEMIVFSALTPDQIDLAKTSSEGVSALRAFLDYASGHELALDENTSEQYRDTKEGIAKSICGALKKEGFDTDIAVGHSQYRIDIGVIDPDNPEKYILGILLDGPCYGSSKTTRDREIAQISVLNGLGWDILRVWSMDWWDNSNKEIHRIVSRLRDLQNGVNDAQADELPQKDDAEPAEETRIPVSESQHINQSKAAIPLYNITELPQYTDIGINSPIEEFAEKAVNAVIENEAPITEELLTRRIVPCLGFARSSSKAQAYMNSLYGKMQLKTTDINGQKLYWRADQEPDSYLGFRASGNDMHKRDSKDVPIPEAVNAICYVLYHQIGLFRDDLIREAAKLMGYTRTGNIVASLFAAALECAGEQGKIEQGANGSWTLSSDFSDAQNIWG